MLTPRPVSYHVLQSFLLFCMINFSQNNNEFNRKFEFNMTMESLKSESLKAKPRASKLNDEARDVNVELNVLTGQGSLLSVIFTQFRQCERETTTTTTTRTSILYIKRWHSKTLQCFLAFALNDLRTHPRLIQMVLHGNELSTMIWFKSCTTSKARLILLTNYDKILKSQLN